MKYKVTISIEANDFTQIEERIENIKQRIKKGSGNGHDGSPHYNYIYDVSKK